MAHSRHKLIYIIILSTIFGLLSGLVGAIVTRVYILEDEFNFPLYGEISLNQKDLSQNLVIRNPRKVIVEQNTKVFEATKSVENSILAIYKKKVINEEKEVANEITENNLFDIDKMYKVSEILGQSFVITSDGWLVSVFAPKELTQTLSDEKMLEVKEKVINEYVVIANDKQIYNVKDIVIDPFSGFVFWQIEANDLLVKKFVSGDDVRRGQSVIAINGNNDILQSTIQNFSDNTNGLVKSSDNYEKVIVLNDVLENLFYGAYLIDLNGDLVALISREGKISSIENYIPFVNRLLNDNVINKVEFGVNYIDLNEMISVDTNVLYEQGIMIYPDNTGVSVKKNSIAELAGFEEYDIILSVNGIILEEKNDFAEVLSKYFEGDELNIIFIRDKEEMDMKVVLTEAM